MGHENFQLDKPRKVIAEAISIDHFRDNLYGRRYNSGFPRPSRNEIPSPAVMFTAIFSICRAAREIDFFDALIRTRIATFQTRSVRGTARRPLETHQSASSSASRIRPVRARRRGVFKVRPLLSNFCGEMIRRLPFTCIRAHQSAAYHRRGRFSIRSPTRGGRRLSSRL